MYTYFSGHERVLQPDSIVIENVRSYHEDIDKIHEIYGDILTDDQGKILILEDGETNKTGAYGGTLISANHGQLSKDARTPGREKYVFYHDDYVKKARYFRGFHPHRSVDAEMGRKVWTWVVERPWLHPVTGVKGRRQVVYVAKQSEDNPRVGILDNIYIPEEGEELPLSAPTPNDFVWLWQKIKAFFYL